MQQRLRTRISTLRFPITDRDRGLHQSGDEFPSILEGRYEARLARNPLETVSALRLRHEVFTVEMGSGTTQVETNGIEFDEFDFRCRHLIVIDRETGATVGTYRLNTLETAGSISGFYSANEFTIENLPFAILEMGVEIGRACIAKEHRNTKVLYLLWKALIRYQEHSGKRFFFGCCSVFTRDPSVGVAAYHQLRSDGFVTDDFAILPKENRLAIDGSRWVGGRVELPALFNMYLRLGARVYGTPMVDNEFGTIDFFVVFDLLQMSERYRKMFRR